MKYTLYRVHKKSFIQSGRKLYETLRMMERKAIEAGDNLSGFIFIDEDFFIHKKRAREFLDCVREGGVSPSIMGFGSVRGLSQFTADEIAEMGFDIIWTAFEGVKSGYKKLRGAKLDHLYRKVTEEGRYLDVYQDKPDYRTFDGFSMHFKHASFKPKELEDRSTVIVDVDGRKLRFVPATRASSQGISPLILLLMRRSKSQRNVDIKT